MNVILWLQYAISLAVVAFVTFGLSKLKKALLRYLKKPPSQP